MEYYMTFSSACHMYYIHHSYEFLRRPGLCKFLKIYTIQLTYDSDMGCILWAPTIERFIFYFISYIAVWNVMWYWLRYNGFGIYFGTEEYTTLANQTHCVYLMICCSSFWIHCKLNSTICFTKHWINHDPVSLIFPSDWKMIGYVHQFIQGI